MTDEMTMPKRRLGTSHWDRKLVANMVTLSNSDNYEEAHKEWIATGDVWWYGRGDLPAWIQSNEHPSKCLCGHDIVYHFRIQNTENGNEEVVGSDHINSYLIIRAIAKETGMRADEITEEQIQKWLNVRVKGMKAEAWWKANGDAFERMFNTVKEADLRYNTRVKEWVYDREVGESKATYTLIKKRGAGEEMASIVWRWNHPENTRAQIISRGYPNDSLMHDLSMFYVKCLTGLNAQLESEKQRYAEKKESLAKRREEAAARDAERRRIAEEKAEAKRLERLAYEERMRPIWEAEAKEQQRRNEETRLRIKRNRIRQEENERKSIVNHLMIHGSKSDQMLEYYGLEPIDWSKADKLSHREAKMISRYLAHIKKLDGASVRRIAEIFGVEE